MVHPLAASERVPDTALNAPPGRRPLSSAPQGDEKPRGQPFVVSSGAHAVERYARCRTDTLESIAGVSELDLSRQSMRDSRPAKWHLAHTTCFFEHAVLARFVAGFAPFRPSGGQALDGQRALDAEAPQRLSGTATLAEVVAYRRAVDDAMARLITQRGDDAELAGLVDLGLRHELAHQETLLADLLHLFDTTPARPVLRRPRGATAMLVQPLAAAWVDIRGGRCAIGDDDAAAAWCGEGPRHEVLLRPFALAARPVTNQDWLDFIADGGYERPALWLPEGWQQVLMQGWRAPAFWHGDGHSRLQTGLTGAAPPDLYAPACHISWFEADAYARWAGKRLPTEAEWEAAAQAQPVAGNFAESGRLRSVPAFADMQSPLRQLYGDVWEWTSSAWAPYPGHHPPTRSAGEFDGKFGTGRYVLRGGSCATPLGRVRASTRHHLQPDRRWQFTGLRLAEDRS